MKNDVVLQGGDRPVTVTVQQPDDWQVREVAGGSVALVAPTREGHFSANVVLAVATIEGQDAWATMLAAVVASRDELPEVEVLGEGEFVVDGRTWFVTEYAFTHPRAGTLVQSVRVAVVGEPGSTELIRATGTLAASAADGDLPVVRRLLGSLSW